MRIPQSTRDNHDKNCAFHAWTFYFMSSAPGSTRQLLSFVFRRTCPDRSFPQNQRWWEALSSFTRSFYKHFYQTKGGQGFTLLRGWSPIFAWNPYRAALSIKICTSCSGALLKGKWALLRGRIRIFNLDPCCRKEVSRPVIRIVELPCSSNRLEKCVRLCIKWYLL